MSSLTEGYKGLSFSLLGNADLEAACGLSDEAGWNQTPEDWRLMIEGGHTVGLFEEEHRPVATITALRYGERYGWLAMLLVARRWRKQGVGSRLFAYGVDHLRGSGLLPALDATEAGEPLYARYGFVPLYRIHRLERPARAGGGTPAGEHGTGAPAAPPRHTSSETPPHAPDAPEGSGRAGPGSRAGPGAPADTLSSLLELDRAAMQFDRAACVRELANRSSSRLYRSADDPQRDIALLRGGHRAWHLGPVYAGSDARARQLIDAALSDVPGEPVYVDVVSTRRDVLKHLEVQGFSYQRAFARMVQSDRITPGPPTELVATAGPEYG